MINATTGEHELVSVETADELANLPQDALEAGEYSNLLTEENPSLAVRLVDFLGGASDPHTAHYTKGSDHGQRTKLIYARDQLAYQKYQDPQIGGGIVIPEVRHRPKDPSTVVGDDNVEW